MRASCRSRSLCELDLVKQRAGVAGHQAPWATILSCADSRVPPELVFGGRGLGELFVARNAGNLADTATIGTLEYGAAVLGSPLIVVLGSQSLRRRQCGLQGRHRQRDVPRLHRADDRPDHSRCPGGARPAGRLLGQQRAGKCAAHGPPSAASSATLAGLVSAGKLQILAAHYDLATGEVEYLANGLVGPLAQPHADG